MKGRGTGSGGTLKEARASVSEIRNASRDSVVHLDQPNVYLPNPTSDAPFDRKADQPYESKVKSLGLAPNNKRHFWQLLKGDSGPGSSIYRRVSLFQEIAGIGARASATPYSKAIAIATDRSKDQRARYWQVSLFGVGRVFETTARTFPLSDDEVLEFAPGIPSNIPVPPGVNVARNVPLVSTTKFRIMVFDESGQRFFDVDCVGARTLNLYAFGVTVFALIKEEGYEIDRQNPTPPEQFAGLLDQSILGGRIIPIRTNFTENPQNNTVTAAVSPTDLILIIPIPTGANSVQVFCSDGNAAFLNFGVQFTDIDPIAPGVSGANGAQGTIEPQPGQSHSSIYRIPDCNAITALRLQDSALSIWSFVFSEVP